jgi:Icc-related predicted phosphoesterase
MRIICVSDTHNKLASVKLPRGDVLVVAGDATNMGTIKELIAFNHVLQQNRHKFKYIVAIPGNHDWLYQKDPGLARSLIPNVTHFLHDDMADIEGIKFYGSAWTPVFFDWAFNLRRGEPLREKWDLIPNDIDVLVTHGPPYKILDSTYDNRNVGCDHLLEAVTRVKPKVHIFGHIHYSYGIKYFNGTTFVNASSCDERYRPINKPIEIEV